MGERGDWIFLRRECGGEEIGVVAPVGLEQDAVDLLEIDAFGLVAHGFEQTGQATVAGAAQEAIGGADDEGEGFLGKGVVGEDEAADLVGVESGDDDRKGNAGLDVLVDVRGMSAEKEKIPLRK